MVLRQVRQACQKYLKLGALKFQIGVTHESQFDPFAFGGIAFAVVDLGIAISRSLGCTRRSRARF